MNRTFAILFALAACGDQPTAAPPEPPKEAVDAPKEATVAPAAGAVALTTDDDKTLYALGQSVGRSLGPFALTPDELKKVEAGIDDAVAGKPPQVDMETFGPKIQAMAEARSASAAKGNSEKSKAFLDQIAASPGAKVMPSGIVFVDVQPGTGKSPTAQDVVKVHYRGTLADGTEFDSSYKRGQPAEFPLGQVIPCWTEGIQLLKVGGKAKLGCPSNLAYGDRGAGGDIPPGAALLFEVELLDIVKR